MTNRIEQANWTVHWRMTESSGIAIFLTDYRGRRVLWEGSLPYITIDHQRADVDVDAESAATHGPLWMPLGRQTLLSPARVTNFRGGFEIAAEFVTGSFRYSQMWRFHEDGRFAPWLTIHGGGLHDQHTYHPHWRFDFDLGASAQNHVEYFSDGQWAQVNQESWLPASEECADDGSVWRQIDKSTGASVNIRPHRLEDAELFSVTYRVGEASSVTPRAGAGAGTYPSAYLGNQALTEADWVLWYVAHVHYQDAFPFTAGPWITVAS